MSRRDIEPSAHPMLQPEQPALQTTVGTQVVVARLVALVDGQPLVQLPDTGEQLARSTLVLCDADAGADLVVVFDRGDPRKPIVIGRLFQPSPVVLAPDTAERPEDVLHLKAREKIVLQCGEASITLTRAGKVVISGKYVLSRSSGVNAVQGGSIELN